MELVVRSLQTMDKAGLEEPALKVVCVISCEKENPIYELLQAMTIQLDKKLNVCTLHLTDKKLLAVLRGRDVVAQELKYHYSCLTALYNKETAYSLTTVSRKGSIFTFVFKAPHLHSDDKYK